MNRCARSCVVCLAGWLALLGTSTASAAVTPKEVEEAIQKAKAYIYSCEKNGNWEWVWDNKPAEGNNGGLTALAVYSLLVAGEKPDDPRIAPAIRYLLTSTTDGTYAVGLRCQVWMALLSMDPPYKPDVRPVMEHDLKLLVNGAKPYEGIGAFWRYRIGPPAMDHSNSQYGVLGVWACAQVGGEVKEKFWKDVDAGWRAHQFVDGGWGYVSVGPALPDPNAPVVGQSPMPRATMTAAGIATLFITDEYLHGMDGIDCKGNMFDANIELGLEWMSKNLQDLERGGREYYGLYGLERIGVASGRKYFGTVDWFKYASEFLVKHQGPTGHWGAEKHCADTCFGLICLVRGRAPVVMNKLEYELNMHGDKPRPANWNERARDCANLVKWIGKQNENLLNWQVVNLKVPAEDLHDAPILYIAGNQAIDLTDEEINKLRLFVEEGGLIFANADCGSKTFTTAFKKICSKLFPDYEFRVLPDNSPIYTRQQYLISKSRTKPPLEALSNGARELIILDPSGDGPRYWQTQAVGGHEVLYQFIDDIFLYMVDRGEKGGLRNKGDNHIVVADPRIKAAKTIKVARLAYAGNWNPEPGSWRRLAAIMHNTQGTDLDVQPVQLGEDKLNNSYNVAHLTGSFKFSLPEAARAEIKKYVEGGGTLIIDSCGGNAEFAESAKKELAAIFPDNNLPDTPPGLSSRVYAAGPSLPRVEYRPIAKKVVGSLRTPRIRVLDIKGRAAVFCSDEDLSTGMVGMPIDGIYGYEPESATALMEKLVLYAAPVAAVAAPATLPTTMPTTLPAAAPTTLPTAAPTTAPTALPTTAPTALPATLPTTH